MRTGAAKSAWRAGVGSVSEVTPAALASADSLRTAGFGGLGGLGTGGTANLVGYNKACASPVLQPCHRSQVKHAIGTPVNSAAASHSHS